MKNRAKDKKFSFLKKEDPYHSFYEQRIKEFAMKEKSKKENNEEKKKETTVVNIK